MTMFQLHYVPVGRVNRFDLAVNERVVNAPRLARNLVGAYTVIHWKDDGHKSVNMIAKLCILCTIDTL